MTNLAPPAPATVVSAVARHLAGIAALGDRVYLGRAPTELSPSSAPFVETIHLAGPTPVARGDGGTIAYEVTAQVDLWEAHADESPELAEAILDLVTGQRLDTVGGARAWRVDLDTVSRIDADDEPGWVRHRIDVRVRINR